MIRTGLIWSGILIAIMVGMSLYGYSAIPADASIAIHWNINGEPDGYTGRTFALWMMPATAFAISLILAFVPAIEPRRKHLVQSGPLFRTAWIGSMLVVAIAHGVVVLTASGFALPVLQVILSTVGLLFVLIGNLLGKSQSNFFVGIRTPWTLSSDASWDKTHRLAGRLWVFGGFVIAAGSFMVAASEIVYLLIGVVLVMTIIPALASYFYWRADKSVQTEEA